MYRGSFTKEFRIGYHSKCLATLLAGCLFYDPVSYTHLDVYKRQVYQHTGLLVCRSPQPTSYLLQVFRQGERGTCQLHELHIGTVEAFGKDIHLSLIHISIPSVAISSSFSFKGQSLVIFTSLKSIEERTIWRVFISKAKIICRNL